MKKIFLMVLMLSVLVGCGNSGSNDDSFVGQLLVKNKIIVGISPDYPPFESMTTDGTIEGFDIDMMNEVIAYINEENNTDLTVEYKSMDFSTIVGALQANQIDIGVSGFTYEADRDVIFSTPYILSNQVVLVNPDSGIKTLEDLKGKKIGAQLGSTGESEAKNIEGAVVQTLGDYTITFQTLKNGQLDAVVCDEAVAKNYVKQMGFVMLEEALTNDNMSIIINKNKTKIADEINKAVEKFINSDKYPAIMEKWEIN